LEGHGGLEGDGRCGPWATAKKDGCTTQFTIDKETNHAKLFFSPTVTCDHGMPSTLALLIFIFQHSNLDTNQT
jgi:hypothetical protein